MFRLLSLSAKIKAVSLVFLLAGLASVSITLWVTWQLEGGAAAVNEAGRLRMQVFRMQLSFQNHEQHVLDQGNARFTASLQLLREGDPSRPLQILWTPPLRTQFARIEEGWQRLSVLQEKATLPEFRAQGDALVQVIDDLVTLLEREMVRWTAGLHLFQLAMVGLVIVAAVLFWMMSYWEVLYPLERLEGGMAHIRQGQLQTRLQLESGGEFGRVASGFNLMAASLQSARENLEFKVREKTASLQAQHAQLQALYTVSAQIYRYFPPQDLVLLCGCSSLLYQRWTMACSPKERPISSPRQQGIEPRHQPRQSQSGQHTIQTHAQGGKGTRLLTDLKGPGRTNPVGRQPDGKAPNCIILDTQQLAQAGGKNGPEHSRQHHQRCSQRRQPTQGLRHGHGDRGGDTFWSQGHQAGVTGPQGSPHRPGRNHSRQTPHNQGDEQGRSHGLQTRPLGIQRNGQGDRGRPQ